jgi:3-oxoacyl-[acyl-carrier-protein] synthase-1
MVKAAISIAGLGMVSSLGYGAEANAAVMRCGYSKVLPTEFYSQNSNEPYLGAQIDGLESLGSERFAEMAGMAIEQVLENHPKLPVDLATIFCLPQIDEIPYEIFEEDFFSFLYSKIGEHRLSSHPLFAYGGRCSVASAFKVAQQKLNEDQHYCLIVAVDSLLDAQRIARYENYADIARLLDEEMPDGFIPGEAAVALLLSRPVPGEIQTCIRGIGFGSEAVTVDSDEVLMGRGLTQAIKEAAAGATVRVCDTDFRLSSANGESYFFQETSLAGTRAMEDKRDFWPLWHPADHIGEVGAVVGAAMVVMAHYAFEKNYAPGARVLCELSNDNSQRAAFILERVAPV